MIVLGALVPHPPIIVPEVGRGRQGEAAGTIEAMAGLAADVARADPETLVFITPHGNVFQDGVAVTGGQVLSGDLGQFGAPARTTRTNDLELAGAIVARAENAGLTSILLGDESGYYGGRTELDHGVLVPLSFIGPAVPGAEMVVIGMSFLPLEDLYRFGMCLAEAVESLGRRVAVVASGDLSHRLTPDAPAGYDPRGAEFDRKLVDLLSHGDVPGVFGIDPVLAEKAGECGYRSVVMMLGSLDGQDLECRVFNYEGPFGVGYAVADFKPTGPDPGRRFMRVFQTEERDRLNRRRREESPLVTLARETVEAYVRGGSRPSEHGALPSEVHKRAGVFVSIKKHGQLRGCIGTIAPTRDDVAEEIRANAIAAATQDPRFSPVSPDELQELDYSVDVLSEPEPIEGLSELDPERYGVIVSRGGRRGLLLPNLEGIETAEEQVDIARRKAGIGGHEEVRLERFEVVRYH